MRGSSRASATVAQQALDGALAQGGAQQLAEDLFAIVGVVDGSASLRRALADPSREGEAKRALAMRLFGGKVSQPAADLTAEVAAQRWAAERDLSDTLEALAVQALLSTAEQGGRADAVEDELFRFERIVAGDTGLRDALSSRNTDAEGKAGLVRTLLTGKASAETIRLAEQAVRVPRGRRLDRVLEGYLELAAQRRDELAAEVHTAVPLSEEQQTRLTAALERIYNKKVGLQLVLDPHVIGGIRVQVGDEVVDGTVLRRLDEARRHISGG